MLITTQYAEITVDGSPMRMFVCAPKTPKAGAGVPGILFYSDIFQLTGPMLRACQRLAGYGFVVAAPEIYHRLEAPGLAIAFDDDGRTRGLENAARTSVKDFDADCRAALDYLAQHPQIAADKLGAAGFCIGGHLAFRAALQPDVRGTVCFYPTGVHNGKLGQDEDAGTFERFNEIAGKMLIVFGSLDPHVPGQGRAKIINGLQQAETRFDVKLYPAEHAFMRDEGPRYDAEATDQAWTEIIAFFRRIFV
ncbi:MAG: dienelactone hydrolase family protein [Acidobacteriota bacterium]